MKVLKLSLLLVAAAFMIMGVTGTTYAFHDGGVGTCESCHTMHESLNGSAIQISDGATKLFPAGTSLYNAGTRYLLKGSDQSSTCLNCHKAADTPTNFGSYHVMSTVSGNGAVPIERGPGGDFAWIKINGLTSAGAVANKGDHKGHQIVAADYGLTASTNYSANGNVSPGGSWPVANLYCSSCHDPHSAERTLPSGAIVKRDDVLLNNATAPIIASGSYGEIPGAGEAVGVYRFLGGAGYKPKSSTATAFANSAPIASAPATYNDSTPGGVRVAYGSGMSEWCANCHGSLLNNAADTSTTHRHPSGSAALLNNALENEFLIYNNYKKSGDLTGSAATAYLALVPYEEGITDRAALLAKTVTTNGPADSATANVMCLSCHRAHASAFPEMTRFAAQGSNQYITMDGSYVGTDNYASSTDSASAKRIADSNGYTVAQMTAAYYGKPASDFATFQRILCNKCHAKD